MKKYYFSIVSVLILILSIIGFSDNLITDIGQKSNSDPKFIIHGIFLFGWMIILVIQTSLIRKGNYQAHRKLGVIGILTAIGVVVSTFYIFVVLFNGWHSMPFNAKANRFFLPSFAVLVFLGYSNRKKAEKHKRFMFLATLLLLEPILSRVGSNTGLNPYIVTPLIWNALFVSLFIYDRAIVKKIHPITYLGFIWFYVVWAIAILT